jgi:hypothetical protein
MRVENMVEKNRPALVMNRAVPIRYVWYVYTSARAQLQSDSLRISKNNSKTTHTLEDVYLPPTSHPNRHRRRSPEPAPPRAESNMR